MGGKHFGSDEKVKATVQKWPQSQPREFFSQGIFALSERWNVCIARHGDYIEK